MLWQGRRESDNVEDARGSGGGRKIAVGGGIGGVILVVAYLLLGGDPAGAGRVPAAIVTSRNPARSIPTRHAMKHRNSSPSSWPIPRTSGTSSSERWAANTRSRSSFSSPNQTRSGCGFASGATGPFYCPEDRRVYIDLSFYRELRDRFGAPGDFAQAYVIAHEVGHHVQNLLGISDKVQAARGRVSETEYNRLSVRLELQADFFAGVWAHFADRAKHVVEAGDIDEALRAATVIGDDNLQRRSRGYVVPESFTHGTSEQRVRWFRKGYETGDLRQGDTFTAREL